MDLDWTKCQHLGRDVQHVSGLHRALEPLGVGEFWMVFNNVFVTPGQIDFAGVAHHLSFERGQKSRLIFREKAHQLLPKHLTQTIVFGIGVQRRDRVLGSEPHVDGRVLAALVRVAVFRCLEVRSQLGDLVEQVMLGQIPLGLRGWMNHVVGDKIVDRHQRLGPVLVRVAGPEFHRHGSQALPPWKSSRPTTV